MQTFTSSQTIHGHQSGGKTLTYSNVHGLGLVEAWWLKNKCCSASNLVQFEEDDRERSVYKDVNLDACLSLLSSVYSVKHKQLYASQSIKSFRESFVSSPLSVKCRRRLEELVYKTLNVCRHDGNGAIWLDALISIKNGTLYIEAIILPSYGTCLIRHCKRACKRSACFKFGI